jgi:prepilin signal peptidase PulO-like enzyme (type II secretory pathway)
MTSLSLLALTFVGFALAGWCGAWLGHELGKRRERFEDGPIPVAADPRLLSIVSALVGAGAAWHGQSPTQLAILALATILLSAVVACDLLCGSIPDALTLLPLAALIIGYACAKNFAPTIAAAVLGIPFALVAWRSKGVGMGWGDVKLAAFGGALLGINAAITAFVVASIAAFVIARLRRKEKEPIAFAPYLVAGISFVLIIGVA